MNLEEYKSITSQWFHLLQDNIIKGLEKLEVDLPSNPSHLPMGHFERKPWERITQTGERGGGGTMALLHGRVFEKAGVHVSTVHGTFPPEFASKIPGADKDPHFWASGISLIIHPWNPHVPTVHMNTRFIVTTQSWFGGGMDLTPMLATRRTQEDADAQHFHAVLRALCEKYHPIVSYETYKDWCDTYFYLKHRQEPRGIGGIFYDNHNSAGKEGGGFETDFAFTKEVGQTFLPLYSEIVRRNWAHPFSKEEREQQEIQRGRYVEFNLLYDRGTIFGLQTGGNVEAILSSMPPSVKWP